MLNFKKTSNSFDFGTFTETLATLIWHIMWSPSIQTNQAYAQPVKCSARKVVTDLKPQISLVSGRNHLQKEGREDLAADLDTQTHASFVDEYSTYKRSVNSATFKHINRPKNWGFCRFQDSHVLRRWPYSWLVRTLKLLQCRWIHDLFVAGVHTNKRSVGLGA